MTITRLPSHVGDPTCSAAVIANGFVFAAHHAGGFERADLVHQTRAALRSLSDTLDRAGSSIADVVQVNLYVRSLDGVRPAWDVFEEFFTAGPPARMTATTDFFDPACLVMVDAIAVVS